GNILQEDIDNAYVADLGLSLSMESKTGKIYGVLPYVAPEVLLGQDFTEKSDITL
ncbi:1639_t:CDS:1, partial [Gigaspora rosea]